MIRKKELKSKEIVHNFPGLSEIGLITNCVYIYMGGHVQCEKKISSLFLHPLLITIALRDKFIILFVIDGRRPLSTILI